MILLWIPLWILLWSKGGRGTSGVRQDRAGYSAVAHTQIETDVFEKHGDAVTPKHGDADTRDIENGKGSGHFHGAKQNLHFAYTGFTQRLHLEDTISSSREANAVPPCGVTVLDIFDPLKNPISETQLGN